MTKVFTVILFVLAPALSQALECEVVNTFVSSNSDATYPWKAMKVKEDSAKFYTATMEDKNCQFMVNHAAVNGDMYSVYIQDTETSLAASGNAAFDSQGRFYFTLSNASSSSVCMLRCNQ